MIANACMHDRRCTMLERVERATREIYERASARDETVEFPAEEMEALNAAGALAACVPAELGGLGFGTDAEAAADTLALLRLIGAASLPLGRVFEGHLNAVRLTTRLGTAAQAQAVAQDARAGHLFGVWATDDGRDPLRLDGEILRGAKVLASGAGTVTRALVTAGDTLLLVPLAPGERADISGWTAQGMRASATGRVSFDGIALREVERIGPPGAYLRQPDFSGGAWRPSAVALGGLDAMMREFRGGLVARQRHGNAHQQARAGLAMIAQQTASLWLSHAASLAEAEERDAELVAAAVGLARIAVEAACLDAMRLAQRSLGLASFMRPAPIERICRDLATYLRQPAPDETLTEAAAYFMQNALPAV